MQTHLRRGLATLATSALALGALSITATSHASTADPAPARAAASWLTGNLNAANLLETASEWEGETYAGPSYGTTVDFAQGLLSVGGLDATATKVVDAIAANLDAYIGSGGETYSGSAAKVLALAEAAGRDSAAFGGQDLLERVEATVQSTAPVAGRLKDVSAYGDYANTIGQAFAARALTDADSALAPSVTAYLLDQQCSAGFFRLYLPSADAANQTCDGATPAEPAEQSADTTALAVIQLADLTDADTDAAVAKAADWLASQQQADGSFVDPANGANTNTTGLAAWALREAGRDRAAAKAAVWLRQHQVVGACAPGKLAGENGAVAYDRLGWNDGVRWGITDPLDRSQWLIADVQALPALAAAPANTAKDAVVLPTFAKAGTTVRATLKGLAAGERACVTGAAGSKDLLGNGKDVAVSIVAAKAGTRSVTLKTGTGVVTGSVKVLGKKKITVKVAKKAKRNTKKKVTVRGVAAGEKITVKVKAGKKKAVTVKVGRASKKGTFTTRIKVGKKAGTVKVSVQGQYKNRTGSAKVSVK